MLLVRCDGGANRLHFLWGLIVFGFFGLGRVVGAPLVVVALLPCVVLVGFVLLIPWVGGVAVLGIPLGSRAPLLLYGLEVGFISARVIAGVGFVSWFGVIIAVACG